MEDVTFLQECGITIDSRWLAEMLCEQAPEEVSNYLKSLMRIADTLGLSGSACDESEDFDFTKVKGRILLREAAPYFPIYRRSGSGSGSQLIVTSDFSGSCGPKPVLSVVSVASLAARAFSCHPSTASFLSASGFRFRSSYELRFRFPCGLLLRSSDGSCLLSPTGGLLLR